MAVAADGCKDDAVQQSRKIAGCRHGSLAGASTPASSPGQHRAKVNLCFGLGLLALLTTFDCYAAEPVTVPAAGNPTAGANWFPVCASCHGERAEGLDALGAPRLAGLPVAYIVRQLKNFREGLRGAQPIDTYGQQMAPMAVFLADDTAAQDIAAFIETLPRDKEPSSVAKSATGKGAALYKTCAACHGSAGEGSTTIGAPPLAGQKRGYVVRQLENFRSGLRGTEDDFGRQMRASIAALPDRHALADVADYVATFRSSDIPATQ